MTISGKLVARKALFSRNHLSHMSTAVASLSAGTLPVRSLVSTSHAVRKSLPFASSNSFPSCLMASAAGVPRMSSGMASRDILSILMEPEMVVKPTAGRRTNSELRQSSP